jgi:protein-disulfide isomerase
MENQTNTNEQDTDQNIDSVNQIKKPARAGGENKNTLLVPIFIIIGIIVLLIVLIKIPNNNSALTLPSGEKVPTLNQAKQQLEQAKNATEIPDQKLSQSDHWQGNPKARIVIFEYSDLDCPFCIRFHSTMKQLVNDYPNDVLWVYRHFPLDDLHPKARTEAIASECVAKIAGNYAFWKFLDSALAFTSSNVEDPLPTLKGFATGLGIDPKAFDSCIATNNIDKKISEIITNQANIGIQSGAKGTPFNVILDRQTGAVYPAPGAQDIETMHEIIKTILAE